VWDLILTENRSRAFSKSCSSYALRAAAHVSSSALRERDIARRRRKLEVKVYKPNMIGSCVPDTSLGERMVESGINSKHKKERGEKQGEI